MICFFCTIFLLNACWYLNSVLFTIKFVLLRFGLIQNVVCDRKCTRKKDSLIKGTTGIKQHIQNTNIRNYLCRHVLHCMKDWGRDRILVGFTTTYAISAYHHWYCELESRSGWGVHYVIKFVCDLQQDGGFLWILVFPPPIKLTATIQLKYCLRILLKVALNTIKPNKSKPILWDHSTVATQTYTFSSYLFTWYKVLHLLLIY